MSLADDLAQLLTPDQVSQNPSVLDHHSRDESYHQPRRPDVVVFPQSTEDVARVLRYAQQHRVPVVPFGTGTALEGHVVPVRGGISLDMARMNRVQEIRPADFLVCAEPGVTRRQLNRELRPHGLFFPVDPGADASLGGMAATGASGTTTVRYGAMRDNVRKLEVVLAGGRVVEIGSLAAKSASGYHLTGLFIGSEGTLGVITKLWLRVYGVPEWTVAARAEFPDVDSAVRASTALIGAGVAVARLELVDEVYMAAVNRFKGTAYEEVPTLFLEFHGSRGAVEADIAVAREIATEEGCTRFTFVAEEAERNRLWEARHAALHALMAQYPGRRHMATDVCVPVSKLPEAIARARRRMRELGVCGGIVGHVGDGNYHVGLAVNPDDPDDMAKAEALNEAVVEHALALGGTCTGEHGVGLGKRRYQAREHGDALELMRAVKQLFDPLDILNPGKLVDPD
ncbi:MAG: FAD-binding protein [Alicyclobacillaceae bacterium]|nr:FAD-binding protein [Alicyclobacillaceae bacterium]